MMDTKREIEAAEKGLDAAGIARSTAAGHPYSVYGRIDLLTRQRDELAAALRELTDTIAVRCPEGIEYAVLERAWNAIDSAKQALARVGEGGE